MRGSYRQEIAPPLRRNPASPNTTILEAEFEQEGGATVYEVEMDNGVDMTIDAISGALISSVDD